MKKTWLVKELSVLTKVPVSTLHYYDEIGLLVPTIRRANGYRVYSHDDLVRLQHISGLKFLGFSLENIRELLDADIDIATHFKSQRALVAHKIERLQHVVDALDTALDELSDDQHVTTQTICTLIERYRMSKEIAKGWRKICTPTEFKQFEQLDNLHTDEWQAFIAGAQERLDANPASEESIAFVKDGQALFTRIYKDAPKLLGALVRAKKNNTMPEELFPAPIFAWVRQVKQAAGLD